VKRHTGGVNSTETPGGSGIPAGWYDDPSGRGLRWWDGDAWTEHVHTAESAAAAAGASPGGGEQEAPPPELVKLRESIRGKGAKGVGIALGVVVLVIVVVALLVSGGSEDNGANAQPGTTPGAGKTGTGGTAAKQKQIKKIDKQLQNKNLSRAQKMKLQVQKEKLEKSVKKTAKSAKKKATGAAKSSGAKKTTKKVAPGEEGN
jgi:hypothetical protein